MKKSIAAAMFLLANGLVHADSVDTLRDFIRDVKTGKSQFTQTVTASDGKKKRISTGNFEFQRPNQFRFAYAKPFEQLIVADGQKVWIFDADLNQVSSRKFSAALGATPASLLAGGSLDKDFDLVALPAKDGLDWAQATPKAKDGSFQSVQVGFRGKVLAAVAIIDSFGQHSLLQFSQFANNPALPSDSFKFNVPAGADVIEQ